MSTAHPVLAGMLCCPHLEILYDFLNKGSHILLSHWTPPNYVAGPGLSRSSMAAAYKTSEAGDKHEPGGLGHWVPS